MLRPFSLPYSPNCLEVVFKGGHVLATRLQRPCNSKKPFLTRKIGDFPYAFSASS